MLAQPSTTQNVFWSTLWTGIDSTLFLKVGQLRSKGHWIWVMDKIDGHRHF